MLPYFFWLYFPCSADHERDWPPPFKVVFLGLVTNTTLNVPLSLSLCGMLLTLTLTLTEGLDAFRFLFSTPPVHTHSLIYFEKYENQILRPVLYIAINMLVFCAQLQGLVFYPAAVVPHKIT